MKRRTADCPLLAGIRCQSGFCTPALADDGSDVCRLIHHISGSEAIGVCCHRRRPLLLPVTDNPFVPLVMQLMIVSISGLLLLSCTCLPVAGQYNDARCKCICPSPQVVANGTAGGSAGDKPQRSVYIGNVDREQCNCDGVVLPQLTSDVQDKAKEFCPWCECKYESRNTTTIKWVVSMLIALIVILVLYMTFLILFDPTLHKAGRRQYEEQVDDEEQTEMREPHDQQVVDETSAVSGTAPPLDSYTQFNAIIRSSPRNSLSEATTENSDAVVVSIAGATAVTGGPAGVLNRAVQHQNKWKKQVQEQRKNIYDKHTMLN